MFSFNFNPRSWFILLLASTLLTQVAAQASECSTINTGTTARNTSIYQSNGLCHDFCVQNYAFAIVQSDACWCSNFAPASLTTLSSCNSPCPGFPLDLCGGGTDLFGYIVLNKAPSGTRGGSTSTVIVPSSTTTTPSTTKSSTTNSAPPAQSSTSDPTTTPSSSSSLTWTPTPITAVQTITGLVQTVTFVPTSPPTSSQSNGLDQSSSGGGGLNTGQAVGLTVGLVALVALVGLLAWFCIRKRRKAAAEQDDFVESNPGSAGGGAIVPSRSMSENSRYMLGTDGRHVVEGWEADADNQPGNRKSKLMPVDPRLDPFASVYQNRDGGKSRESVQTIQDNHDYSRRVHQQGPILRTTNPD